jgi:hypothetical protein
LLFYDAETQFKILPCVGETVMVPEVFFALGVGVVSGLFSTILVFLGAKYWNSVVIPWYEERVYKDIRIAGEWRTRGKESGEEFSETAIIKQNAHRVWGEITYRTEDEFILIRVRGRASKSDSFGEILGEGTEQPGQRHLHFNGEGQWGYPAGLLCLVYGHRERGNW